MRMVFPKQMTGRFMDDLASDMNTLVETLLGETPADSCGEQGCDANSKSPRWAGPMDVVETDGEYRITVDLPGADAEKIEIDVNEDSVSLVAVREKTELAEGEQGLRNERRHGHFHRTVSLPKPVDQDATAAEYVDGVLTVTLPKTVELPKSRRVQVTRGE